MLLVRLNQAINMSRPFNPMVNWIPTIVQVSEMAFFYILVAFCSSVQQGVYGNESVMKRSAPDTR